MNGRIPEWIKMKVPGGENYIRLKRATAAVHTVCLEAKCPNIGECFCEGSAAFLILGDCCTRSCRYCAVRHGAPAAVDADEPALVADAVAELGLSFAVVTSVTRDDLCDGGALHFAACVAQIRKRMPSCGIELLIPDFRDKEGALEKVFAARPDIINHNIEAARSVFSALRPQGNYDYSLRVLRRIADAGFPAKSGLMIGFGETTDDIERTMDELKAAGCSMLTVGQYLRSYRDGFPVAKFYTPDEFNSIAEKAKRIGFSRVLSGPLVRSSYHAARVNGVPCS